MAEIHEEAVGHHVCLLGECQVLPLARLLGRRLELLSIRALDSQGCGTWLAKWEVREESFLQVWAGWEELLQEGPVVGKEEESAWGWTREWGVGWEVLLLKMGRG